MTGCLIVSRTADEFAAEIARTATDLPPPAVCSSSAQALDVYAGQSVLFGDPDRVAAILPRLPAVEWVQSTWAGVKPLIDIRRRDYVLTGVKNTFGPQIAEYVIGYLLACELRVLERMQRQGRHDWFAKPSGTLQGKRLGVMGTGSIAAHVARTARAFDMKITGLNRTGTPAPDFEETMPVSQLHDFLGGLDYLVSTLPETQRTDNLLDQVALTKLPPHAYLVNVGRGNVLDDRALIDALRQGRLGGAVLDVFDEEPVPRDSPLWDTPGLMMTAHIAALSHPSLVVPIFIDNYRRYIKGESLNHVIDLEKGY